MKFEQVSSDDHQISVAGVGMSRGNGCTDRGVGMSRRGWVCPEGGGYFLICDPFHYTYSGGFRGAPPVRAPPTAQNFLDFMQFFGKFDKIVCWRPPEGRRPLLQGILDPPLTCDVTYPHLPCEQTDACENITFLQLPLRGVKMES